MECLLAFDAESFVLQSAIPKVRNNKDQGIEKCNFACCFVWV